MVSQNKTFSIEENNLIKLTALEDALGMKKSEMVNEALRRYFQEMKQETGFDEPIEA